MSLPLLGAGMATDGLSAVLDLNFASLLSLTPSVGPTPSFTRASTGTYFDASGVLTTAAINGPRFDHVYNGSSWVSKGLLIEEARTNNLLQSNSFSTVWTALDGVAVANSGTSPDGTNNAWKLNELATSTPNHGIYQGPIGVAGAVPSTLSVYAKMGERNWMQIAPYDGSANYFTWFDLSNGTVGTNPAGNTATITPVGNGWYRCSVSRSSNSLYHQIFSANGDNNGSYSGEVGKGIYIYGAQLEAGSFPTSYIPTTSATVTRSADVCQITGGDFSGFYNQTEGSLAVEYDQIKPLNIGTVVNFNDGGTSNAMWDYASEGTYLGNDYGSSFYIRSGGTFTVENPNYPIGLGQQKYSVGFKSNDFAMSYLGRTVQTDATVTIPTVNQMGIGKPLFVGYPFSGHIARLRYFNTRLLNSQLVALST